MRTTLVIDDEVLSAVKKLAVENDSNVSHIVNEALRRFLKQRPDQTESAFRLPTFRGDGPQIDASPSELAHLDEASVKPE